MPGHTSVSRSVLVKNDGSSRKTEAQLVGERVSKTKKEIEELKAQLQKLINDGIHSTETVENVPDKTAVSNNDKDTNSANVVTEVDRTKAKNFKDNVAEILGATSTVIAKQSSSIKEHANVIRLQRNQSPTIPVTEESPKKIRHYDKEAARQYIKKQREKRKALMKNVTKDNLLSHDIKKQRLQELHQKSMQLVMQNIKSKKGKAHSRSQDALNQATENHTIKNAQEDLVNQETIPKIDNLVPNIVFNETKSIPSRLVTSTKKFAHPQLRNITIRSPELIENGNVAQLVDDSKPTALDRHKAATIIQAAYRQYRQRKLLTPEIQKPPQKLSKEIQTNQTAKVPIWLQTPTALPYPYNFISTVKRKLNVAVQQIANNNITGISDVAVQSSFIETRVDNKDKTRSKSEKATIEEEATANKSNSNHKNTDLKSFLSHKCLDLDLKTIEPLVLTRKSNLTDNITKNGCASDSDTSKNIPEISSECSLIPTTSKPVHSCKRSYSSDTDELKFNTDSVKKLKLRQPKSVKLDNKGSRSNSEVSENIQESRHNRDSDPEMELNLNQSSRRDSVIAYNKCDYSWRSKSSKSNGISAVSKSHSIQSYHNTATNLSSIKTDVCKNKDDALNSFQSYMKNLNDESVVTQNLDLSKTSEKSVKNTNSVYNDNSNNHGTIETISQSSSKKSSDIDGIMSLKKPDVNLEIPSTRSDKSHKTAQEYSSNFASITSTIISSMPALKRPSISLRSSRISDTETSMKSDGDVVNIILKPGEKTITENRIKSNEIHLKFEAELHLLNEFNDSLRQVMAVEKSLLELHNNNANKAAATTLRTQDTQTSIVTKSSSDTKTNDLEVSKMQESQIPSINYSRGSEIVEEINSVNLNDSFGDANNTSSLITTGLELSHLKDNVLTSSIEESNVDVATVSIKDNYYNGNAYAGLSLEMFEQLIKDEDARIENLKTILKIREKALVDRTKGELAWLEIQKKHLKDSGQQQEISTIKKKQRGLLIKLEHERHEMQRLKQMQKAASKERKSALREQRNMIKAQLSMAGNMITKIKRNNTKEERRQSGPLKVYNIKSHSESIRSETSMSRQSSAAEEIISVISHSHSIVSRVTTDEAIPFADELSQNNKDVVPVSNNPRIKTDSVKRSLLMREATLQKRRKAAEELLQWHQRLLEEERKITELELAATAIINQIPTAPNSSSVSDNNHSNKESYKFKGSHLNLLWHNMTGRDDKKFNDRLMYSMSRISLERFCSDAKRHALSKNKKEVAATELTRAKSDSSLSTSIKTTVSKSRSNRHSKLNDEREYMSDFESVFSQPSIQESIPISSLSNEVDENLTNNKFVDLDLRSPHSEEITEIIDQPSSQVDKFSSSDTVTNKTEVLNDNTEHTFGSDITTNDFKEPTNEVSSDNDEIEEDPLKTGELGNSDVINEEISKSAKESEADQTLVSSSHTNDGRAYQNNNDALKTDDQLNSTFIIGNELKSKSVEIDTNFNLTNGIDDLTEEISKSSINTEPDSENKNNADPEFRKLEEVDEIAIDSSITRSRETSIGSEVEETDLKNDLLEIPAKSVDTEDETTEAKTDQSNSQIEEHLSEENSILTDVSPKTSENQISTDVHSSEQKSLLLENSKSVEQTKNESVSDTEISINKTHENNITEANDETKETSTELNKETIEHDKSIDNQTDIEIKSSQSLSEKVESPALSLSYGFIEKKTSDIEKTDESISEIESEKCESFPDQLDNKTSSGTSVKHIDVKKRVSEILADANLASPRGDRSPRLQDLYTTTYDVVSPEHSPDSVSPTEIEQAFSPPHHVYGNDEVEELLKKQLAIEQEIKEIQQQQQKEQLPYLYLREIPNKPPPPYTPPIAVQAPVTGSTLPISEQQIGTITAATATILHNAYINDNLQNITLSEEDKETLYNECNVEKTCYEFIFDLSKEAAIEHYKQFEPETGPLWMHLTKKNKLALGNPLDKDGLQKLITKKVRQLLGYEIVKATENIKHKWSSKKRDHVDELLVVECQAEETEWTNYDRDELIVKDELTKDIMNMLLSETAQVFKNILTKKTLLC